MPRPALLPAISALALAVAGGASDARAARVIDPGQGRVEVAPGTTGVSELSGIAFAGGDRFYAVSDSGGRLFPIEIRVDPASGYVLSALPGPPRVLAGSFDLEGIALGADGDVLVADEAGPAIREHRLSDGARVRRIPLPPIFRKSRPNLSLESLSRAGDALWTANEEALSVDGPVATARAGSRVRLQRLDLEGAAVGQWAYATDPFPGAPFLRLEASGVADLLALPNGELIVLERAFSSRGFRARLYQVEFAGATDTTALDRLAGAACVPVGKRLLWDSGATPDNYEGLALGRALDGGGWSVLLVSDDGDSETSGLYPLRLEYGEEPPQPPPPKGAP